MSTSVQILVLSVSTTVHGKAPERHFCTIYRLRHFKSGKYREFDCNLQALQDFLIDLVEVFYHFAFQVGSRSILSTYMLVFPG